MSSSEGKTDVCLSCEFQENLDIIREIYFFSPLPLELLKVLAYLCSRETFREGDPLFSQEDDDGQAFYIISGKVRLSRKSETGEQDLREYGTGAFLGGLSLVGKMRRIFTLQADTDTVCLVLSREKFTKALEQFPDQIPKIFTALVERIIIWEERFLNEIDLNCASCRRMIGISNI